MTMILCAAECCQVVGWFGLLVRCLADWLVDGLSRYVLEFADEACYCNSFISFFFVYVFFLISMDFFSELIRMHTCVNICMHVYVYLRI